MSSAIVGAPRCRGKNSRSGPGPGGGIRAVFAQDSLATWSLRRARRSASSVGGICPAPSGRLRSGMAARGKPNGPLSGGPNTHKDPNPGAVDDIALLIDAYFVMHTTDPAGLGHVPYLAEGLVMRFSGGFYLQ